MALGYRTLSRKSHQRKALFRDLITDLICVFFVVTISFMLLPAI